jgi:hypothetical protein
MYISSFENYDLRIQYQAGIKSINLERFYF